jgi:16S rRNA (guanine527-N7)-methyltransferase
MTDLRVTLQAGLQELGLVLDPRQVDLMLDFLGLLQKWNKVYNLTSLRDPAEMMTHHLLDSLAVVRPLLKQVGDRPVKLLDVGSGGGLPGVVIAIACPQIDVTCVDTVAKKAAFIQQVAVSLRLSNLHGLHARVETLNAMSGPAYDVVAARAFSSLLDFTRWSREALAPRGIWMAMKGKHPGDELETLSVEGGAVDVFHVEPLKVPRLDAERCLVWMRPGPPSVA